MGTSSVTRSIRPYVNGGPEPIALFYGRDIIELAGFEITRQELWLLAYHSRKACEELEIMDEIGQ